MSEHEETNSMEFVDRYYVMNPEEDDILPNGKGLRLGMRVLVEDWSLRVDLTHGFDELMFMFQYRARQYNRWCRVTYLKKTDRAIQFIGVYDDGTKMTWNDPITTSWIYKKDSVERMVQEGVELDKNWQPPMAVDPVNELIGGKCSVDDGPEVYTHHKPQTKLRENEKVRWLGEG